MRIVIPYTQRFLALPNQNFRTLMDAFCMHGKERNIDVRCINENEIHKTNDFDILLSIRTFGLQSEQILQHYRQNGIRVVIWHDDIFAYRFRLPIPLAPRTGRLPFLMEMADLLFLPCYHLAMQRRTYRRYADKCMWMPWSVPDAAFDRPSLPWEQRKDRALLSGRISWHYALRKKVYRHALHHEDLGVDVLEHPSYDTNSPLHRITGNDYIDFLATYRRAVVTTAFGITAAKYMEIPAAGCLMLAEKSSDFSRLGFRDEENCRVFSRWNFKRVLGRTEQQRDRQIALAGYHLVRTQHVHSIRVKQMLDAITDRHEKVWKRQAKF